MTETPNSGGQVEPDGWAAWSKKDGDRLKPPAPKKLAGDAPEQGEGEEQPPASES